jgi:hypothetical protein
VRAALKIYFIRQQTNFTTSLFKHATLCAGLKTRRNSTSSELCPCIGPVPTWTSTENPGTAKALLLGASSDYGLFFTSGFHRLGGFGRSRQSWRRPNDTQSATPNCGSVGQRTSWPIRTAFPATRLQLSSLLDKLVPRRSSSNPFLTRAWGEAGGAPARPRKPEALRAARHRPEPRGPLPLPGGGLAPPAPGPTKQNGQGPLHLPAPPLLLSAATACCLRISYICSWWLDYVNYVTP